jgi:hypothetical protein
VQEQVQEPPPGDLRDKLDAETLERLERLRRGARD